jgi:hypothetical protein
MASDEEDDAGCLVGKAFPGLREGEVAQTARMTNKAAVLRHMNAPRSTFPQLLLC